MGPLSQAKIDIIGYQIANRSKFISSKLPQIESSPTHPSTMASRRLQPPLPQTTHLHTTAPMRRRIARHPPCDLGHLEECLPFLTSSRMRHINIGCNQQFP